jgi:hypothetical protein
MRTIVAGSLVVLCAAGFAFGADGAKGSNDNWLLALEDTKPEGMPMKSPATIPATEPTQPAEAPASWPPGLLMELFKDAGVSKPMDDLGIRFWGFVETGFTGRLMGGQDPLPGRFYDARRVNDLRLNQFDITAERPYDATKNFDFGARFDFLFGGDAKLTHAAGLMDAAGEGNGEAWTDLLQGYGQLWFKTGKDSGLEIDGGKFVELAGIEYVQSAQNALYSHSYLFNFAEPTTNTGAYAKYILSPELYGYAGVVEGWDVFNDNNNAVTYIAGGGWSSKEQVGSHPRAQVLLNVLTGPEQAKNSRDYRTLTDVVLCYYWTDKLSEMVNIDWLTEENVPGVGRANAYGPAHYLTYTFNDYLSATWRIEWFRDDGGSRTGVDCSWYESTWGLGITPCPNDKVLKNLVIRPELRWDWADKDAFGSGRRDLLTAAVDLIFKF